MAELHLLDSCVWIDYFIGKKEANNAVDNELPIATSVLTLLEVAKTLQKFEHPSQKIAMALDFIKEKSHLINADEEISRHAILFITQLCSMDALIYSTAHVNKFLFVTRDNDFRGLPNVTII